MTLVQLRLAAACAPTATLGELAERLARYERGHVGTGRGARLDNALRELHLVGA